MIKKYNQFSKKRINENTAGVVADRNEDSSVDIYELKLKELSDLLGVEAIDNKIQFKGEEIIFPSETEMYHVGKHKFKTAAEVAKYFRNK
jgi:hypothetical protein